jgi:hypothetical protein
MKIANRKIPISLFFKLAGVTLFIGIIVVISMYYKPHRSVESEQAIVIDARQLFLEYETDESLANTKYLNKAVEVTGTVAEITINQNNKTVLLLETSNPMFGVSCTLESDNSNVEIGSSVSIKGICTGYLSDVVITQGIVIAGR